MRVLALSSWWFFPADNGARMRCSSLLAALAKHHEVHLLAFTQEAITTAQREQAQNIFKSVNDIPQKIWVPKPFEQISSLWHNTPASVRASFDPQADALIQKTVATIEPDLVIAVANHMIPYARRVQGIRRVVDDLEITNILDAYRNTSAGRRVRNWLTWIKLQSYMRDVLQSFDLCTVTSRREKEYVVRLAPAGLQVEVIPNGALVEDTIPDVKPDQNTLIYPGALSFSANMDAMRYFLHDIFPQVRAQKPELRLRITGKTTQEQRNALPHIDGIEFTGYVEDIRTAVASAWAEVVPLREGAGTRLKILEALALGTPVIATTKGAEGLELVNGQDLLIADTPQQFVEATLRLLNDPSLRMSLGQRGQQSVRERYNWYEIGKQYTHLISQIGVRAEHERLSV